MHESVAGMVLCFEETTADLVHHIVCIFAALLHTCDGLVVRRHLEDVYLECRGFVSYEFRFV